MNTMNAVHAARPTEVASREERMVRVSERTTFMQQESEARKAWEARIYPPEPPMVIEATMVDGQMVYRLSA